MVCFVGSMLSIAMLELAIELLWSPLTEAHMHHAKLLSKAYIEQRLEALVYVGDKVHIYFFSQCSCALVCHFDCV